MNYDFKFKTSFKKNPEFRDPLYKKYFEGFIIFTSNIKAYKSLK